MKIRWFSIILVCFLMAGNAFAQEPTPGGIIYSYLAEIIFPSAVRFTIVVDRPLADIDVVILTIHPEGQDAVVIPMDNDENVIYTEAFTEYEYLWSIPRTSPPRLFQNLEFSWQVTADGSTGEIDSMVEFTDARAIWQEDTAPGSEIVFYTPDSNFPIALFQLRRDMQATYDLLAENTEQQPAFNVMFYPAIVAPGCAADDEGSLVAVGNLTGTTVECNAAQATAVYAGSEIVPLRLSSVDTEARLRLALADLFTQGFYEPLWSGRDVPAWFQYGLAQFYLPTLRANLLDPVQTASRNNRLFTLDELATLPSQDVDLWRAQSYGMVLYIADRIGVEGLFDLAREESTFAESYETATGEPLNRLLTQWERWIFTSGAENAYGYNPHMVETSTPTATPTDTPLPPTFTPTLTDTPTITPTVTNTGVPEIIFPTWTATRTPTRAPATITPRPAGSFALPTPTATPTFFDTIGRSNPLGFGALAVGLILLAILSFIYVRMTNRR